MNIIKMWISMKKKEIEFKLMFYTYGIRFMDEKQEFVKTIWNVYESIKDTQVNELRDKLIYELAGLAHEQALKEKQEQKEKQDDN